MSSDKYFVNTRGAVCLILGLILATAIFVFVVGPLHNLIQAKVAKLCGDDWVEDAGYFSMKPSNSFHWIGTFSAFLVFMGFTKRVRYRQRYLHAPVLGSFLISFSGILTYFLLFLVFAFLSTFMECLSLYGLTSPSTMPETELPFWGCVFHTVFSVSFFLTRMCMYSAFFNLIPVAPMDMGEVLFAFIGNHWREQIKKNDMIISVGLFVFAFFSLGMPGSFITEISLDIIYFFQDAFAVFINIFI